MHELQDRPLPLSGRARRWIYFAIGWLCFGLGALGALLPVLPTTPFMILAVWAFSRSSVRFHEWLYNHPRFGGRVRDYHQHRVIPLPVKLTAFAAMAASLAYVVLIAGIAWHWVAGMALVMLVGVVFISRCPSRPPSPSTDGGEGMGARRMAK